MRISPILIAVLLVFGFVEGSRAQQQPRTAAPLGVGGGGPAYVRGQDALFLNPANLVLTARPDGALLVQTSSLSVYTGGDLIRFGTYDETFTRGRRLTGAEVSAALDDWFGASGQLRFAGAYADFVPMTLSYHRSGWAVGASVRARLYARIGTNRGWFDLGLRGGRNGTPTPLHADWRALSTVEITLGGSRRLADGRWTVGVAPKLVLGTEYLDARFRSTARLSGEEFRHDYDYRVRSAGRFVNQVIEGKVEQVDRLEKFNLLENGPYVGSELVAGGEFLRPFRNVRGVGAGVDLGGSYRWSPQTLVSLSLTDLGGIRWKDGAQVLRSAQNQVRFEGVNLSDERISEEYDGDLGAYVQNEFGSRLDTAYTQFERKRTSFVTSLPAAAHVGADWRPPGPMESLSGGLSVALNDISGNLSQAPVGHLGAVLRVGGRTYALLPRAGVRIGGASALALSGGMGIRLPYLSLDAGLSGTPSTAGLGRGGRYTLGLDLRVSLPAGW